ncbi:hypothetical protein PS2_019118 [Malus domestica]
MPHFPGEQIRQVKMIPCSMWRQRVEETSKEECSLHSQLSRRRSELRNSRSWHICLKKQAEKNAACTVSSVEGVRAKELKKLPHLPEETSREECSLHSQLSRRSLS